MIAQSDPLDESANVQLPVIIPSAMSAVTTAMPDAHLIPTLIVDAGDAAGWRYIEFFTANIRNPHTSRAYARACSQFFGWCEGRGLTPRSGRSMSRPI
jgi:hypothetical protein